MNTNINSTAMKLAWLLLKINRIMTTKVKSFSYFLGIAYKMLKSDDHFIYVVNGLINIYYKMLRHDSITSHRLYAHQLCVDAIVASSNVVVANKVVW
jgi:hypothetical protein